MDVDARSEGADRQAEDDAPLVAAALAGDSRAFDSLARRYQKRVVAVAYRLLSNAHDAADVAQDALFRAYRNLDQLADHHRFGPWLMRIVSNLSLNYRRARKSSAAVTLDDGLNESDALRDPAGASGVETDGPTLQAPAEELRIAMDLAIQALPEKQRACLVLSSIEGVAQKEVAEMLNCSVELVKWNVFQARKTLAQALSGFLPQERD